MLRRDTRGDSADLKAGYVGNTSPICCETIERQPAPKSTIRSAEPGSRELATCMGARVPLTFKEMKK